MKVKLVNMNNPATARRRQIKAKTGNNFNSKEYYRKKAKKLKEWKGWF